MLQFMLQGFPDGAIRIGPVVSVLSKDGRVTYFVGPDNYFSHAAGDAAAQRMAIATLIANRHVRVCEVETSPLGIARRNLMRWTRQLAEKGSGSFFTPRRVRGGAVMTAEKASECGRLLDEGKSIPAAVGLTGVNESTLRKALAAEGMGAACTRADERMAAAVGLMKSAVTRFEACRDVNMGGLLAELSQREYGGCEGIPSAFSGSGIWSGRIASAVFHT